MSSTARKRADARTVARADQRRVARSQNAAVHLAVAGDRLLERIAGVVAEAYGVEVSDLKSKSRQAKFVLPRHIAMYFGKTVADCSFPAIGGWFGGRDHTVAMFAERKIERLMAGSETLAAQIGLLRKQIENRQSGGARSKTRRLKAVGASFYGPAWELPMAKTLKVRRELVEAWDQGIFQIPRDLDAEICSFVAEQRTLDERRRRITARLDGLRMR